MQDWKMWHKNVGRENAGLENTAQEILGWKMQEKSVWKANRRFIHSIKWITVYWHNKNITHMRPQFCLQIGRNKKVDIGVVTAALRSCK